MMSIELNHTIIWCSDKARSAAFMTDILGLPPARTRPGEINRHYGGRGLYFADPDSHLQEIITTPYGDGPP